MANTYIDTNQLSRTRLPGSGEVVEILNKSLCGAKNVVGSLHWLDRGEHLEAQSDGRTHQLLYLMEGEATITLEGKPHEVAKGAGVYLGPAESARISHRGTARVKVFHLAVPRQV